ncbi:glycosyltransferase family 4 protein [Thomasclavelia sp.]|uniref:glycosyltransferase family 4 protein n=1 Tax=Thomasclavelia sp. TaxID=3025757 RepID=UPI0025E12F45|nr:glycosyltransferase family 4 protein [Thomasclavelia sp.]
MRKKITFIVTRVFWPSNSGRKVVLYNYCKGLYDLHNCEVNLYIFPETNQTYNETIMTKPYFINKIEFADKVSYFDKITNLFTKTLIKQWPLQCSLYYSKNNGNKIKKFIQDTNSEIVFVDMVRLAEYIDYFKEITKTTVINFDDLLSKRYKRQIKQLGNKGNIAGVYGKQLSGFMNSIINNQFLKKMILSYESRLTEKYEIEISNQYDFSLFISKIEANEFEKKGTSSKVLSITMGIDERYLKIPLNLENRKKNYISYLGNYNYGANQDSIKIICEKIMPLILDKDPNIILKAVGPCPEELKDKYSSRNIIFTGEVDDISAELLETSVFLGYVAYGTGIKTKILEASAMGLPVVTNSVGAEGIELVHDQEIFISDNFNVMSDYVIKLRNDEQLLISVINNARKKLELDYKWENILLEFKEIVGGNT